MTFRVGFFMVSDCTPQPVRNNAGIYNCDVSLMKKKVSMDINL